MKENVLGLNAMSDTVDARTLLPFFKGNALSHPGSYDYDSYRLQYDSTDSLVVKCLPLFSGTQFSHLTLAKSVWAYIISRYTNSQTVNFFVVQRDLIEPTKEIYPCDIRIDNNENIGQLLERIENSSPALASFDSTKRDDSQNRIGIGDPDRHLSRFPLELSVSFNEGISLLLSYSKDIIDEYYVYQMAGHFHHVLSQFVDPDLAVRDIDLLTSPELNRIISSFNDTATEYPHTKTIIDLFQEQVNRDPEKIAVLDDTLQMTYRELDHKSNEIACKVLSLSTASMTVAICVGRSSLAIPIMLGILKARKRYLSIDLKTPPLRIKYMIDVSGASLAVVNSEHIEKFSYLSEVCAVVGVDQKIDWSAQPVTPSTHFDDVAHIIYTSGSTGTPKGVMVTHRNVVSLVKNVTWFPFEREDVLLSTGSPAFDATTFEYWGMLLNGGKLVFCGEETIVSPQALKGVIEKNKVKKMWLTSSLLNEIVNNDISCLQELAVLIAGGEKLSPPHIARLKKEYPHLRIINGYGPTENTTFSLTHEITDSVADKPIPIGKPIDNRSVFILDNEFRVCSVGVYGELFVGGDGVTKGYLNDPELTAKKFIQNPIENCCHKTLYRTGDIGRWLPTGVVEFSGRQDDQVKINGFRIELAEIQLAIGQCGLVKDSVVVVSKLNGSEAKLVGYVVPLPGFSQRRVIEFLGQRLPSYMVPHLWVELEKFPLNRNGKIDVRQLQAPDVRSPLFKTDAQIDGLNATALALVQIWKRILNIDSVDIDDTFFDLGGHSLLLAKLGNEVRKEFGVILSPQILFDNPTIRILTKAIEEGNKSQPTAAGAAQFDAALATPAQRALFISKKFNPHEKYPNSSIALEIFGDLDITKLEQALQAVIDRNDALRTTFYFEKSAVRLRIHTEYKFCIRVVESDDTNVDNVIRSLTFPFDFGKPPLVRVFFIKWTTGRQFLYMDMPHICSDGISLKIIIEEASTLYADGVLEPKLQFRDFQHFLSNYVQSSNYTTDQLFWKKRFALVDNAAASARPDPGTGKSLNADSVVRKLPREVWDEIGASAKTIQVSKFQLLFASYCLFYFRFFGSPSFRVHLPVHNRNQPGFERIVGFLVNSILLDQHIDSRQTIESFIRDCRENLFVALNHGSFPAEDLYERKLVSHRHYKEGGETFFSYHNHEPTYFFGNCTARFYAHRKDRVAVKISTDVYDMEEEAIVLVMGDSSVSEPDLEEMIDVFVECTRQLVANLNATVGDMIKAIVINEQSTENEKLVQRSGHMDGEVAHHI